MTYVLRVFAGIAARAICFSDRMERLLRKSAARAVIKNGCGREWKRTNGMHTSNVFARVVARMS